MIDLAELKKVNNMSKKFETDKKPRWETFFTKGIYYNVVYRYKNKEYEDGGTFQAWEYGNFYFRCDNGEWIIVKPFNLISATTETSSNDTI